MIWELFHPSSSPARGFSVAEALVEPGQSTEAHFHDNSQEVYYFLEGSGSMLLGEESTIVTAGDAVLIEQGILHSVKNTSTGAMRILCICCPSYAHEDTKLKTK
jgi:mannose-6-phosphate isomerase-like protein (cupin superfamily)